jgi:hypothetical protein
MLGWIWPSAVELQQRYDRIRGVRCSTCRTPFRPWQRSCSKCGAERIWMRDTVTFGSDGKYHRVHRASRPLSLKEAKQRVLRYQPSPSDKENGTRRRVQAHSIEQVIDQFILAVLRRCPGFMSAGRELLDIRLGRAAGDTVFPPAAFQELASLLATRTQLAERWSDEGETLPDHMDQQGRRRVVHRILDATLEALGMTEAHREIGRRYLRAPTVREKQRQKQQWAFWAWKLDCCLDDGRVDLRDAMESIRMWLASRLPDVPRPSAKLFSEMMAAEFGVARHDSSHSHRVSFTGISLKSLRAE